MVFYPELGIREGKTAFIIGYEYGITDYPFTCLRLGFKLDGIVQWETSLKE